MRGAAAPELFDAYPRAGSRHSIWLQTKRERQRRIRRQDSAQGVDSGPLFCVKTLRASAAGNTPKFANEFAHDWHRVGGPVRVGGEMLNVVLLEPEIPPNTGNIGRLCLATGSVLHLIEPLGFSLDDKLLKRAGLDYWPLVQLKRWADWAEFRSSLAVGARMWFLTTKTDAVYWDAPFRDGDYLVFGRETRGLPSTLLSENPDACLTIPMAPETRSLNLATAVGIVLYEAVRKITSPK